ncbi:hypothetical protein [Piscinibacter sp. XHJ-5]|uniref:hypothetical protein n=1 Tax=Piscinibacter sp. XHJ-5 TaxID=3037797 RepID=UPI0024528138|nr:hypothetical protein [Piscinibacter sp. XHJ-5]
MTPLTVLASGMVTALGFNAPASLAALRAGISAIGQTVWVDTESGQPLSGAKISLPQWWEGLDKLADLAAPAIHECLVAAQPEPPQRIPLLLGIAAAGRRARTPGIDEGLLEAIETRLDLAHHPRSRVFAQDQAGCAMALLEAQNLIVAGAARRVVIAGVDSFLHQPTLETYIDQRRLMTPGNSNGFFPGEAGCAVLVGMGGAASDGLRIEGFGIGREPATIESTLPLRAVGLTQAVQEALDNAGLAMSDVSYRLTDLSGEHYKFKEAAFVAGRLDSGERDGVLELWHPIEFLGEIGAAVLPCLLAQALHAAQEDYAPGPVALCHIGTEDGIRAALVVSMHGAELRR